MTLQDSSDQRKVFLGLLPEEQFRMLYDMVAYIRSKQAEEIKDHLNFKKDLKYLEGELRGVGRRKEISLTTSQKITNALDKRSAAWIWVRDRVIAPTLSYLLTLITSGILYLIFGGKLP